ncbi:MAG TPA: hypothetical protein VFG34_10645 [Sphingopyxis sp.]|nr:hypothetical protein [Sphingopyxis sp.]
MMSLIAASALMALSQAAGGVAAPAPSAVTPPPPIIDDGPAFRARTACSPNGCLSAVEAVTYASYLAPKAGLAAIVSMRVRQLGFEDGIFYLNSELDYRDRNNLTVTVREEDMRTLFSDTVLHAIRHKLIGKMIYARGVARRVRIDFMTDAQKPSGKYYYQVQMRLNDASDLMTNELFAQSEKARATH